MRFALLVVLSVGTSCAFALSCGMPDPAIEARLLFGPAKLVFIGKLISTTGEERFEGWHTSVDGVFTVERVFKGAAGVTQIVRI